MEVAEEFCKYLDGDTSTGTAAEKTNSYVKNHFLFSIEDFLQS